MHFGRRVLSRIITLNRKMLRNIGICGVTVLLCREGKGEKKGVKAISDWLEGELKLFIKKFRGGTAV